MFGERFYQLLSVEETKQLVVLHTENKSYNLSTENFHILFSHSIILKNNSFSCLPAALSFRHPCIVSFFSVQGRLLLLNR